MAKESVNSPVEKNQMNNLSVIKLLDNYCAFDAIEYEHLNKITDFINSNDDLFSRNNSVGHLTASAIVIDNTSENILLIWHEKLQRWLQPGGHVEVEADTNLAEAARRELIEETLLDISAITLESELPFDLDVHTIPARKEEPEHNHYDVRFLFRYHHGKEISTMYKWVPVKQVLEMNSTSLSRFARKITVMYPAPPAQ